MAGQRPSASRRVAALVAMALVAAVVVVAVARGLGDPLRLLFELLLFVTVVGAAWVALIRTATARVLALVTALIALAALLAGLARKEGSFLGTLIVAILLLAIGAGLARYALGTTMRALKAANLSGPPAEPAQRGVLFMNLKSGGGKAERFDLVDECRRRGIEPVVLEPGEDWLARVRDVASSGADVVGMAGGDGSQAMVGDRRGGARAADGGRPGGHAEPPRARPRAGPGRRGRCARRVRRGRRAAIGPRRRERPRVREQRVARPVRGDRPLARVPGREGGHDARRRCRRCSDRERSRSTCGSPDRTARRTAAPT